LNNHQVFVGTLNQPMNKLYEKNEIIAGQKRVKKSLITAYPKIMGKAL
jgi:hypothetical protein